MIQIKFSFTIGFEYIFYWNSGCLCNIIIKPKLWISFDNKFLICKPKDIIDFGLENLDTIIQSDIINSLSHGRTLDNVQYNPYHISV